MAPIVHAVEIDRTPEDVFAYVTDPSHFTEWQDAVVSARLEGSEPVHQGSRIELTRRMGKREQTMHSELEEYRPLVVRRQAQKELLESHANLKQRLESA